MVVKRRFREAETTEQRLQRWLRHHYTPDRINEAQALPLRRDMVTFLTYVRDHTLEDFGAVTCTCHDHPLVSRLKELDSFEITPLGAALLDSLLIQTSWR